MTHRHSGERGARAERRTRGHFVDQDHADNVEIGENCDVAVLPGRAWRMFLKIQNDSDSDRGLEVV